MKILHLIHSANPNGGGPIEGIKQLSLNAIHSGHDVEVCSLDSPNEPFVKDFPLTLHAMGPALTKYGYSRRLQPFLNQQAPNFDIFVVNGIWQYHSLAARQTARLQGTPYVVFTHGMLDPWFKHTYPLKHLKKWLYWPWGEYPVLRDAAAVLFTTEEERLAARQSFWLYQAKENVVSYGTERPSGDSQQQLSAFYQRFPQLIGKRICLFLGRIHPKKGCDLAIRAFAETLATQPDHHLLLAGPDQVGWQPALLDLVAELDLSGRVTFAGMLSGNLKWGAFHSADIFFLPSHQENFGIAVAEALACRLPVLISDKVNIWREVENHQAGIVKPDNLAGSISLLSEWLKITEQQKLMMRENALRCFNQHFEIDSARRSLYSILSSIAHPQPAPLVHA